MATSGPPKRSDGAGGVRVNPPREAMRGTRGRTARLRTRGHSVKPRPPGRAFCRAIDGRSPGRDYPASPVGSKGKKARKPQHSQHLPKAGTKTDQQRLMHEEHGAILDTMGMGGAGKGTKSAVWVVGALLLVGAVLAFIVLTVALS